MKRKNGISKETVWKYVSNQIPESEKDKVLAEINNSKALQEEYAKMKSAWSLSSAEDTFSDKEVDQKFNEFREKHILKVKSGVFLSAFVRYAAIFILSLATSWFIFKSTGNKPVQVSSYQPIIFKTSLNQVAKVTLSDGSSVWLNGNSKLEVVEGLNNKDKREVTLLGEAYFEIFKDSLRPFSVNTTQGSTIRVLGTTFDIDAYNDNKVVTTLFEGSVELRGNNKKLAVLSPGERAIYYVDTEKVKIKKVCAENVALWKEELLIFKDEQLCSIAPKLEKFYHVKIVLKNDRVKKLKISGRALKTNSIEQVMGVFGVVSDIRYRVKTHDDGKKIICIY